METVTKPWNDISSRQWRELTKYSTETAVIMCPNTNKYFTPDGWKTANEQYPEKWNADQIRLCRYKYRHYS